MFTCSCGQQVRSIYCDQDNLHYPADTCQDCYDKAHGIITYSGSINDTDDLPF